MTQEESLSNHSVQSKHILPKKNKVKPKAFVEDHLKAHKIDSDSLPEDVNSDISTFKHKREIPVHLRLRKKNQDQQKVGAIIHN